MKYGAVTPYLDDMGVTLIDTIAFKIPLYPGTHFDISRKLDIITKIHGETGEEITRFCRGSLAGSWDSRISVSIRDREFVWMPDKTSVKCGRTVLMACDPFLYCEFSLQKFLYAINCFTYSMHTALDGVYLFSEFIQEKIGCLPPVEIWEIERLDPSNVVKFPDQQTMDQYLELLKRVEFPRRKTKSIVYQSSVMWVGAGQSFKLYGKQAEFKAHDRKRLNSFFQNSEISDMITSRLDGCLRVELTLRKTVLRKRGIKYFFDLFECDLPKMMRDNMNRIGLQMENMRVWTSAEVRSLLLNHCVSGSGISPDAAFSIWVDMVVSGRASARARVGKRKFYRATQVFRNLGISTVTSLTENEVVLHPASLEPYHDAKILSFLMSHKIELPCQYLHAA